MVTEHTGIYTTYEDLHEIAIDRRLELFDVYLVKAAEPKVVDLDVSFSEYSHSMRASRGIRHCMSDFQYVSYMYEVIL